ARLVERGGPTLRGEAEIHGRLPRSDEWKNAVPDDAALQILVEAEVHEGLQEIAGLRCPARDAGSNQSGNGIRRAGAVGWGVSKERDDIAGGGEPDAEHEWILRRVN